MTKKAAVFEETYKAYLKKISTLDFSSFADKLGGELSGHSLRIPLCGETYTISGTGISDAAGAKAGFAQSILLCRYLLGCPEEIPQSGAWAAYRDFKDAAPLTGYFATNVQQAIEQTFAGKVTALQNAAAKLGGKPFDDGTAYDLSVLIQLLPRIPVLIRFNDSDSDFPAQFSMLFRESTEKYLDMESLAIGGALVVGRLKHLVNG